MAMSYAIGWDCLECAYGRVVQCCVGIVCNMYVFQHSCLDYMYMSMQQASLLLWQPVLSVFSPPWTELLAAAPLLVAL